MPWFDQLPTLLQLNLITTPKKSTAEQKNLCPAFPQTQSMISEGGMMKTYGDEVDWNVQTQFSVTSRLNNRIINIDRALQW